eukprot:TRINITY_DN12562_c0_g1_i1.p2 TRINITY_DN12562_c0_g1~~TRINITY_DN12562_c0_g1_i1.p2  ORF type:complete len:130 (+),score=47.38 TRINITY_DN12562_c0_g1_i1:35-391(+)
MPKAQPPPAKTAAAAGGRKSAGKAAPAGRGGLLSEIAKGKRLKHVEVKTAEERKKEREAAALRTPTRPGSGVGGAGTPPGQMDMMGALASALAQRRKKIVIDLAANPFDDDDDEGEWE